MIILAFIILGVGLFIALNVFIVEKIYSLKFEKSVTT